MGGIRKDLDAQRLIWCRSDSAGHAGARLGELCATFSDSPLNDHDTDSRLLRNLTDLFGSEGDKLNVTITVAGNKPLRCGSLIFKDNREQNIRVRRSLTLQ
jgi:hypothetical protein